MKNLLFLAFLAFLFVSKPTKAQLSSQGLEIQIENQNTQPSQVYYLGTGFNGTNFFDSNTSYELQWVVQWIPKGQSLIIRARFDKEMGVSPFLDEIKALNQLFIDSGRTLLFIFTANMFDTPENNMYNLNWLINNNIKVICWEAGNETYAREIFNFNFLAYQNVFEPMTEMVELAYPTMNISIFVAPRPNGAGIRGGRNEHSTFNNLAIIYMKDKPFTWGISEHIYFNQSEWKTIDSVIAKRLIVPEYMDVELNNLSARHLDIVYEGTRLDLIDSTMAYLYKSFPGRKIWITEFQYENGNENKNMLWNGMATFILWHYLEKFPNTYFLEHMGKGNTNAGNISLAGKFDLNPDNLTMLRRVNYWVYELYRKYPLGIPEYNNQFLDEPGIYNFWYANKGNILQPIPIIKPGLSIESFDIEYIEGKNLYSSSGGIYAMAKGSPPSYDINGTHHSTGLFIPALSFGVITIRVEDVRVFGCIDTSYFEFNEMANTPDMTQCLTKKIYGCMNSTYIEYDPRANISTGCLTKIPPKICYKKRWLFGGCKIDKTCEVRNCSKN